jgi:hypothetical protein
MSSPGEGGDIIIKGGSVEVDFDNIIYQPDPVDPTRHLNANRKISRVLVEDEDGKVQFDSGDSPDGLVWTITVSTA